MPFTHNVLKQQGTKRDREDRGEKAVTASVNCILEGSVE